LFGGTFGASSFWTWKAVAKLIDGVPLTVQREIDLFCDALAAPNYQPSRCAVFSS